MPTRIEHFCNFGGMAVAIGTIAGYVPVIAGTTLSVLGCIYYGLQIADLIQKKRLVKR